MDIEKVNMFIATKGEYFPAEAIPMIRERLLNANAESEMAILSLSYISPVLNIVLSVFFGEIGIDRFIIGDIGLGIGKLLTTCCCGLGLVWWFVDLFLIMDATRKKNLDKLMAFI